MKSHFVLIACVLFSLYTNAQVAGALDSTFGTNGIVITTVGSTTYCGSSALAVQPDGKIIAVGNIYGGYGSNTDFGLARYNSDGTLDNSFGTSGKVTYSTGSATNSCNAVALQPDGKIVLTGNINNGFQNRDFITIRYNTDGTLDNTFGNGGTVITSLESLDYPKAVIIQPDKKILVSGVASLNIAGNGSFGLVRYDSTGTLDNSFGSGGIVIAPTSVYNEGDAMALQSDGRIVLAGVIKDAFSWSRFGVARFKPNGNLDSTFGTNGKVISSFGGLGDFAYAVAIQQDGKIVVAGRTNNSVGVGVADFGMARYDTSGNLDNTFGTSGLVVTSFSSDHDAANAIIIQPDKKIVLAGYVNYSSAYFIPDFALARYDTLGSLDNSFGYQGKVVTTISSSWDEALGMVLEPDGKIVVSGAGEYNTSFVLARYQTGLAIPTEVNPVEAQQASVEIYPNPFSATAFLRIISSAPHNETCQLKIYNLLGKEIWRCEFHSQAYAIDRNHLSEGMYIYTVQSGNEIIAAGKLSVGN